MVSHRLDVFPSDQWVLEATNVFQHFIEESLAARDRCIIGVSGGSTPGPVFAQLAKRKLAWSRIILVQVDERVASVDSGVRNLVGLESAFRGLPVRIVAMAVQDVDHGAGRFLADLQTVAGRPPVLDIVHLGLGEDGHTASLVPDDPILQVGDRDVAATDTYRGYQRLSMTRPVLERARLVLWLVRGADKAGSLHRLLSGDQSIPAGALRPIRSAVLADSPAMLGLCP